MARDIRHDLGGGWFQVLDQLGEAVIVLDRDRILRHANPAARRLLGYDGGRTVEGRCRATTRGIDCEKACPLTFALQTEMKTVEDFATVYRTADGRALHLDVTIVPFESADGEFLGAVEILRPNSPRPGFFTCGVSEVAADLQGRVAEIAAGEGDVALIGEGPSCLDVARTIHRFSGLPDNLFSLWNGSWSDVAPWPPGTVYGYGCGVYPDIEKGRPEGWRIIVGGARHEGLDGVELWELPPVVELLDDLERMIGVWVDEMAPGKSISADALEQLVAIARESGLEEVENTLQTAVAAASDRVDIHHLPENGRRRVLVDEILQTENPLAALEETVLREVVERCGWRMQEAAERLGISRVTLWRKMKDLGIDRP